jgi:sarcosine oxidase subunit alpha
LTTPYEAALEWTLRMDKPFFVGQRSLRIVQKRTPRRRLVGFALEHGLAAGAPKECHLIIQDGGIAGRVTSVAFSETLGRHLGLALIAPELAREGNRFSIRADGGHMVEAAVVKTPFYDAAAERQKVA